VDLETLKALGALASQLGVPTVILIFVLWQQFRDKKTQSLVDRAIIDMAAAQKAHAELQKQVVGLLKDCADGHKETAAALGEIKGNFQFLQAMVRN
jgi:hypothetical protein